jgi:hypothetical protein
MDYVSTIGDLMASMPVGGFDTLLATTIANDVMTELISQRFNWKFNRIVVPPFLTNSWQQDYCSINQQNIGWLENAARVDINNTSLPKPIKWVEAVKDLPITSDQLGWPTQICWMPNDQLQQGVWPGAQQAYTNPLGVAVTPSNPPTNILDAHGNILVLTTYGVTGLVAPDAGAAPAVGATVNDGTCVWTVANPKAQGIRISPLPSQQGTTWQIKPFAQARAIRFANMGQLLDPLPDDYAKYFQDGVIAYAHRHSTAPVVRNRFKQAKEDWLAAVAQARGQGDRERDAAGFVPDRGVMSETYYGPVGPAWPYGPYGS